MSVENLRRVLDQLTDIDRNTSMLAYFKYHRITGAVARKHGFAEKIGAAVFAALSPNNDYYGNLRDMNRVLSAVASGQSIDSFKVSTYGNNKRKAWKIALGEITPEEAIVANKTRNFYLNVSNPFDPHPVTIDGHMYNAWNFKRVTLVGAAMRNNDRIYNEVADGVRLLAQEHGVMGNQMQGFIWFTWRKLHGIKAEPQLEFWSKDDFSAGLGYVARPPSAMSGENPVSLGSLARAL